MDFSTFRASAQAYYQEIPPEFKDGIDALVVERRSEEHPDLPDIWTMGHCYTEDFATDFGGPETTRSKVVLYWGSFQEIARRDPGFDWEEELWETLTHELRHHLESLAREDGLEGVDYAMDETFKRDQGDDFDPWYYQHGDEPTPGVFQVERNYYVEQEWRPEDFQAVEMLDFDFGDARYRIERPEVLGDVHYVWVHGVVEPPATLELVLTRKRSWWGEVKRMMATTRPELWESEARARRVAEPSADEG